MLTYREDTAKITEEGKHVVRRALQNGALQLYPNGRILSGPQRSSPYYFDSKCFASGADYNALGKAYICALQRRSHLSKNFDVIFGLAHGIPLAAMVVSMLWHRGREDKAVAWQWKEDGKEPESAGHTLEGQRIIIIDDVISTGVSIRKACSFIRQHGGIPVGALIAFERFECAGEEICSASQQVALEENIEVVAASTVYDLISVLQEKEEEIDYREIRNYFPKELDRAEMLEKVLAYHARYGVKE